MSNNTTLDQLSLQTLATQVPQDLAWIVLSILGVLTNVLVIVTIASAKSLRNKSQYVILSHALSEVINCCVYFSTGLARYIAYLYSNPETSSQFTCILKQLPLYLTGFAVKYFTVILALDRFLCICFPVFYKTRNTRSYLLVLNLFCWGTCLVKSSLAFYSYDEFKKLPVCTHATAFAPDYIRNSSIASNVITSLTAFIYIVTASFLFYSYKNADFTGISQRAEWRRQMDFDSFIAMTAVGTLFLVTYGISSVLSSIVSTQLSLETNIKLAPLASSLIFISCISHLFVYLKIGSSFRKAFLKVFLKKDNSVIVLVPEVRQ